MYIIKNALRCISRSKGRNILIGIIALVIAVSACIGLSIRQAAESAKKSTLEGMSVTATISYDRQSMMGSMGGGKGGGFDRGQFSEMMGNVASLTLDEYRHYATAESVRDFYYTITAYFNGNDAFLPVSDETESDEDTNNGSSGSHGFQGRPGGMGGAAVSGDFTLIGYSGDNAMTDFISGNASVLDGGSMFTEGTSEYVCIISQELAVYNSLSVGDTVVITNPSLESESYTLTVSGIYASASTNDFSTSAFGTMQDPANRIYVSANALQSIIDSSTAVSTTVTDENSGRETESAVRGSINATYVFADTDAYYTFEKEVRALGLSESFAVSSADISAFENSLTPLKTLSTMAGWFLIVILIIGGIILVVLNIFSVRERKYEVGVLTAMGMKKWKVAAQFICEILIVTMLAVTLGAGVGAVSALPVTNALLENQVESQSSKQNSMDKNFGRPGNMQGNMGGMAGEEIPPEPPSNVPSDSGEKNRPFDNMLGGAANYITKVNSAMNLTVVLQMLGVGLLLTLIGGASSVMFIMRYDPLKILANRD